MKNPNPVNGKAIGRFITSFGRLLLFSVVFLCLFDAWGLSERGGLLVPLKGYLTLIFIGVLTQFAGAAIPNMGKPVKTKSGKTA